jgi:hypothetical protein
MVHRGQGHDQAEVLDVHAADLRHPAEVVAQEVHDHEVLGALLVVGAEAGRVGAGRARALDRPRLDTAPGHAEEQLR